MVSKNLSSEAISKIGITYQIIMIVVGLIQMSLAAFKLWGSTLSQLYPVTLMGAAILEGVILIIISVLTTFILVQYRRGGYSSAYLAYHVAHGLAILVMAGLTAWAMISLSQIGSSAFNGPTPFGTADGKMLKASLSRLWNRIDTPTALAIQASFKCCGFEDYLDRIQDPCTHYSPAVGCAFAMGQTWREGASHLTSLLTFSLVFLLVLVGVDILVIWSLWRDRRGVQMIREHISSGTRLCKSSNNNTNNNSQEAVYKPSSQPINIATPKNTTPPTVFQ